MAYDVVVVGAGYGGLTVAALLSARGVSTCLLERQSQVGGCVGRVEFSDHDFEPGMGLYTSFGDDEIHSKIFSELPVSLPKASLITTEYVVRLSDGTDVVMYPDERFDEELARVFPECAKQAVEFFKKVSELKLTRPKGPLERIRDLWTIRSLRTRPANLLESLTNTSPRFQAFIDAQLKAFLHTTVDSCKAESAAAALELARGKRYSIEGGPATIAETLAASIKQSGGVVRLNSPVLRLAYDQSGAAVGVDLLSGETVMATRAIVSNMTIWDTYGKLVGLNRTPAELKKTLNATHGSGAYLIYASMEASAASRLPATHFLVSTADEDQDAVEFTFATGSGPSPTGKQAVTLKMRTDVDEWFAFQSSEEDYTQRDQLALEKFWNRLHASVPELGGSIEVLETATPRTFYDLTRRKLGMVMGVDQSTDAHAFQTTVSNLFMVGDTVSNGASLATVSESALRLANTLTRSF